MAITSLEDAYQLIRDNGARGEMTAQSALAITEQGLSGQLVAGLLTYRYTDIAEEDNGKLFSVLDWPLIHLHQPSHLCDELRNK